MKIPKVIVYLLLDELTECYTTLMSQVTYVYKNGRKIHYHGTCLIPVLYVKSI